MPERQDDAEQLMSEREAQTERSMEAAAPPRRRPRIWLWILVGVLAIAVLYAISYLMNPPVCCALPSPAPTLGPTVTLVDETGTLTVEVPASWQDVDLEPVEGTIARIAASSSLEELQSGQYLVSGVEVFAVPVDSSAAALPDAVRDVLPRDCTLDDSGFTDDAESFELHWRYYFCGEEETDLWVSAQILKARPEPALVIALRTVPDEGDIAELVLSSVGLVAGN